MNCTSLVRLLPLMWWLWLSGCASAPSKPAPRPVVQQAASLPAPGAEWMAPRWRAYLMWLEQVLSSSQPVPKPTPTTSGPASSTSPR